MRAFAANEVFKFLADVRRRFLGVAQAVKIDAFATDDMGEQEAHAHAQVAERRDRHGPLPMPAEDQPQAGGRKAPEVRARVTGAHPLESGDGDQQRPATS